MALAQAMLDRRVQIRGMIENFNPQVVTLDTVREEAKRSLKSVASLLLDFVPVIGNVKMASEAIRGYDLVTGEPLPTWQRALCALGAAAPFIVKGIKLAHGAVKGVNVATDVASEIGKTAKAAETIGESAKVDGLTKKITEWLGKDARMIKNQNNDYVFLSKDGTKRVRFDINKPFPHESVHGHVDVLVNGEWQESGPIFPKDVTPK